MTNEEIIDEIDETSTRFIRIMAKDYGLNPDDSVSTLRRKLIEKLIAENEETNNPKDSWA